MIGSNVVDATGTSNLQRTLLPRYASMFSEWKTWLEADLEILATVSATNLREVWTT